MRTFE